MGEWDREKRDFDSGNGEKRRRVETGKEREGVSDKGEGNGEKRIWV